MTTQAETASKSALRPEWTNARRIVVKIGSALLTDRATGTLKADWLASLLDDVAELTAQGKQVVLVSSGAIALGRHTLKLPKGALELEQSQAAAAVGQISLAHAYQDMCRARGLVAAQILLTLGDTEERTRYLNARHTIETLLDLKAVPVVNENDTVATTEIRYGDNDRLSARVASMVSADCLVLLSDIDGLYTAPPNANANATRLDVVTAITPEIEAMAGDAGTELSKGGMKHQDRGGEDRARRRHAHGHRQRQGAKPAALDRRGRAVHLVPRPLRSDDGAKRWISGQLEPKGYVYVDAGAEKALAAGKSLLPAGVKRLEGRFDRGDAVVIRAAGRPRAGPRPHRLCQHRRRAYHRQEKQRDRHYIWGCRAAMS